MKRDSLSTRSKRPQGPLTDLERSEFYLREGERLAHMGSWSLRADGIFDYWSPETFVIFDFDPSEGIPMLTQWLAALQPDGRDLLTRTIDKMFREGCATASPRGCQSEQLHHNAPLCSVPDLALHEQQAFPFPPLLTGVCPQRNSRVAVLDCPQGQLRMGTLRPSS